MGNRIRRIASAALALALLLSLAALADVKTTGNVYLRKGPGLGYSTITAVPPGTVLKYLGETSVDERGVAWYKVEHNGACWVSSRYSTLREEAKPASPTPSPVPAQNASGNQLIWGAVDGSNSDAGLLLSAIDVAPYYLENLNEAASALFLTNYRTVASEAPYQYYNDALTIGGYSQLTYCELTGAGYSLYGATVGMTLEQVKSLLQEAGLTPYSGWGDSVTFEHPGNWESLFVDERGFDSCINIEHSNGIVTRMSWSTYTG